MQRRSHKNENQHKIIRLFDQLKNEYSNIENELSLCKLERDDYERKRKKFKKFFFTLLVKHQVTEFHHLKNTLNDLEKNYENLEEKVNTRDKLKKRKLESKKPTPNKKQKTQKQKPSFLIEPIRTIQSNPPQRYNVPSMVNPYSTNQQSIPKGNTTYPKDDSGTSTNTGGGGEIPGSTQVQPSKEKMLKQEGNDWVVVHTNFDGQAFPKSNRLNIGLKNSFEHDSVVCCVNFSPDGKFLATGSNRKAKIFDVVEGKLFKTFETRKSLRNKDKDTGGEKEDSYIRSVCFSPCGKYLCAGTEDKAIKVWEFPSGKVKYSLTGHTLDIYSLDFTYDSKFVVSGSGDGKTKIWNLETGKCVHSLGDVDGPKEGVTSVAISPNGKLVAAGSLDCVIRIWDLQTGKFKESFKGHEDSVYSVSFSPDGKVLASGSLDKSLKLWDITGTKPGYRCINTLAGHRDYVLSVAFSPNGKWLLSGSKDRSIQFWDARTNLLQLMLQGHKNSVISVNLSPSEQTFATGSGDFRCRVWKY